MSGDPWADVIGRQVFSPLCEAIAVCRCGTELTIRNVPVNEPEKAASMVVGAEALLDGQHRILALRSADGELVPVARSDARWPYRDDMEHRGEVGSQC